MPYTSLEEKDAEIEFSIGGQWSFVSDPYDFELSPGVILELLGNNAILTEEKFEGGSDEEGGSYEPYSYYTIKDGENEFNFYSYPGKHYSNIVTPLLPLKNNIKIGMNKKDFITNMNFPDSLQSVTKFTLFDDYGYGSFLFRADTLNRFVFSYEEGD